MRARDRRASRRSPSRLYRNDREGKLLGVCAGLADYFGLDPWAVRLAAVGALVFFTLPTLVAYFLAAALIERAPDDLYTNGREEAFWRDVRTDPGATARDLRHRFRELERRLRALEAYVTSREFRVDRDIRDLDR